MAKENPLHQVLEPYRGIYNLQATHRIVLPVVSSVMRDIYDTYLDCHLNWDYDGPDLVDVNFAGIPVIFRDGIQDILVEPRVPDNPLPFDAA